MSFPNQRFGLLRQQNEHRLHDVLRLMPRLPARRGINQAGMSLHELRERILRAVFNVPAKKL
jgi:hypothetical protein